MKRTMLFLLAAVWAFPAQAALLEETVEYTQDGTVLEGYLVYDEALAEPAPGVIVVHDWMGLQDYPRTRARQLAEMGYVAFAADIYGKGVRPQNNAEAAAQAGKYKGDLDLMHARAQAAYDVLAAHRLTDEGRMAAIGYCFGGTVVLEMARAGMDLAGVVSFHGGLGTSRPAQEGDVKAEVLVLHGAADPHVPPEEVAGFQREMDMAAADWQMVLYSDAVHSFSKPAAGNDTASGNAYDARADRRSWEEMQSFFEEIFRTE